MWLSGVLGATLSLGAPLVIAGSGEVVSQRSGVINIGLEGMMLSSAFFAFYVCHVTGNPWLGVLVGAGVGLAMAIASACFVLLLAADQVVVGTGINLFALGLTGSLFVSLFGKTGKLIAVETLPKVGGALNLNPLTFVALLSIPLCWFLLTRTRWGLATRAAGEAPKAAEAAGFSALRLRFQAMALGGILAGIAGAYLTLAQANSFAENMTAGRGFVVIAAVTFGRWTPLGAALASLLIAFAYGMKYLANSLILGLPYQLFDAMPYLLALAVLAFAGRGGAAPASLGVPFRRNTT